MWEECTEGGSPTEKTNLKSPPLKFLNIPKFTSSPEPPLLTSHVNRKGIKALKSLEQFAYYHYGRIFHKQAPRNRQNTGNVTFSDEYPRSSSYCLTTKAKNRLRQVLRYYNLFLEILSRTNIGGGANKFLNLTKIRAMLRIVYGEKRKNVSPSFLFSLPLFYNNVCTKLYSSART